MQFANQIRAFIQQHAKTYSDLSDQIWDFAEIKFDEYQSAELLATYFEESGYEVTRQAGDIPTAFIAQYGTGSPVIAVLGEYDALSNLSQYSAIAEPKPIIKGANGHGCGHNLLGVASVAAVDAIKSLIDEGSFEGTIRYYGCPAEEGGGGKGFMVRAGLFEDVDAAITWHPGTNNGVMSHRMLATTQHYVTFKGRSSHAAASPHLGRSALDAVALVNVGINYLREHLIDDARIHYAITNTGGKAANVVQAEAQALYKLRGPDMAVVKDIYDRFEDIVKGAALMTDCTYEIAFDAGSSNVILNEQLEAIMNEAFEELAPPAFNEEEKQYARMILPTFGGDSTVVYPIDETVQPYKFDMGISHGSSDVGDVSWVVPTVQCFTACFAKDTPFHTWQIVAQGRTSIAHKGMLYAGEIMGLTAAKIFLDPSVLEQAQKDLVKARNGSDYVSPFPQGLKVPVVQKKEAVSL